MGRGMGRLVGYFDPISDVDGLRALPGNGQPKPFNKRAHPIGRDGRAMFSLFARFRVVNNTIQQSIALLVGRISHG